MPSAEVQGLLDDLAHRLQRSVVIDDVHLNLLYSSPHFGDEDEVRIETMLTRRTNSKVVGHILAQGVGTWTRPGTIPPNEEFGQRHARVCVPVRWQGELVAFIMVIDADGTVTTAEMEQISRVAERAAPLLVTELHAPDDTTEQAVLDLVSAEGSLRRRALSQLAESDTASDTDFVTAIRLTVEKGPGASLAHVTVALRSALMVPRPTGTGFRLSAVEEDSAVILLGGRRPMTSHSAQTHSKYVLARLNDLSSGHFTAVAGVGPPVGGLDRAHESAQLAGIAAHAAKVGLFDTAATWEDLGPYGPLLRIPMDQLSNLVIPAELQRLLEIDRDGHLVETLRAFLDAAGSAPAAAATLQIHRTTLYYRLARVEELLGIELSDGRTRLTLHMGILLMDIADRIRGA